MPQPFLFFKFGAHHLRITGVHLNLQGYLASACIYSNFERKEEIFINISLLIKVAIKMIKIAPCSNSMYRIACTESCFTGRG